MQGERVNQSQAKKKLKQAIHTGKKQFADAMLNKYPKLIWKLSTAERTRYYGL